MPSGFDQALGLSYTHLAGDELGEKGVAEGGERAGFALVGGEASQQ